MNIEYDFIKNTSNIERHGVSFEQVINFDFEMALMTQDTRLDYNEQRFNAIGFLDERLHVLTFTYRNKNIRVISFRKANKREVNKYEQSKK